ncbi:DUF6587 family protein [Frateuria aurantia]
MNANAWIQDLILGVILLAAVYYGWRKVAPGPSARVLTRWSTALQRPGHAGWKQRLGRWMTPKSAASGCDSGCSACDGCAPKSEAGPVKAVPLTFHRNPRQP